MSEIPRTNENITSVTSDQRHLKQAIGTAETNNVATRAQKQAQIMLTGMPRGSPRYNLNVT